MGRARTRLLRTKGVSCLVAVALLACGAACGSGYSSPSAPSSFPATAPAPIPPPQPAGVVTISSRGVTPADAQIAVGERVTFVNNDSIPHDIMGGPDPARPECHEIDSVGFLTPGQSRQTAPFQQARLCEYHDHSFHSPLFNGRILIQ